jgi:hypothetical protein
MWRAIVLSAAAHAAKVGMAADAYRVLDAGPVQREGCDMVSFRKPLICLIASLVTGTANAAQLDPPQGIGTVLSNLGGRLDTNQLGSIGLADPAFGSVGFGALGAPLSLVQASAHIGPSTVPNLFGRGGASMSFTFEVLAPMPTVCRC